MTPYTTFDNNSGYFPGKQYKYETVTNDTNIDSTHRKTIVFPFEVRFMDNTRWIIDKEKLFEWFVETYPEYIEPKYDEFFPKEKYGERHKSIGV